MLARSEFYIKWTLYALAGLLCWTVQGTILQRLCIYGVIPFLYPLPCVMLSILEGPFRGTVYSLAAGVLCDLLLPASIPCLYTLIFPVMGLISALIAQNGLKAGILCALICTLTAMALLGCFQTLVLFLQGKDSLWPAAPILAGKETAVTLPFAILIYPLFQAVYRHCHRYD